MNFEEPRRKIVQVMVNGLVMRQDHDYVIIGDNFGTTMLTWNRLPEPGSHVSVMWDDGELYAIPSEGHLSVAFAPYSSPRWISRGDVPDETIPPHPMDWVVESWKDEDKLSFEF